MKKTIYLYLAFLFSAGVANANPVPKNITQTVAQNFCSQNYRLSNPNLTLAYTEYGSDGQAVFYVYTVNTNDGFIIVSAEDATHPIIGSSNKGKFVLPHDNNNFAWWMNCRKQEIMYARINNINATSDIAIEWTGYMNNTIPKTRNFLPGVNPLVQSTWDQSYPYNAMCPSSSVTGCVATAMAQIMRYWSYPSSGHGSSGYWDEHAYGFQNSYGYLAEEYDTVNYNWSATAMPYSPGGSSYEIAKLMYDCGISVAMDYSPFESGSWVITGDYPVCSQTAYVNYFGYNPATIQGLYQSHYTITNWTNLIENELNNGRPVQYVGWDSVNNESGHTWVCDGYNASNQFHMNWGWSGSNDGYFVLNALNAGGYHFNWWNEALIGIEPPATSPYFVASPTFGCSSLNVQFTDMSIANATITSRKWLFPGGTPSTSANTNPLVVYNTPGTYDVSEIVTDVNGTDTLVRKAYISVASTATLPLAQNFQSATFPPSGWVINNPNNYSYVWELNTITGGFGASTQSLYFNNCQGYQDYVPAGKAGLDIIGQRQQIYTPEYDFTTVPRPVLYFDVAYAPYSSIFSDTLVIYYSTDCGTTFHQIYSKGGLTLGTTGGTYVTTGADTNSIGCFLPASNNWRTDTIHIPAIAGVNNVMFSFENRSGNGSPLYLDNINIPSATSGIASVSVVPSVRVYPNPGNGLFTFGLTNISGNSLVKIYNVLGQEVFTAALKNANNSINLTTESKGIYIYRVYSESGSAIATGRLVIE